MENEEVKVTDARMTPANVVKFITQHMSAEKALEILLASTLVKYDKIKVNQGEEVHPIMLMTLAAFELGWDLVIEDESVSPDVRGLVIGNTEYLQSLGFVKEEGTENE